MSNESKTELDAYFEEYAWALEFIADSTHTVEAKKSTLISLVSNAYYRGVSNGIDRLHRNLEKNKGGKS